MNLDLGVGTVVRIKQYPFTDQVGSKTAPAVVLSSRMYHVEKRELITARITSKLHHRDTFGTVVISDHEACGLPEPSIIKPVVMTVLISHVQKVVGRLDEKTLKDLRQLFVTEIFAELLGQNG
ncbi:MAG TPA: type II toxin-antitoxin system PemK/MazF family toxin [Thermoanaerobaculia bacterium]|nr:type II toxin-antitoxin system PemK/MazF family toxin [Thermoanaerobaculia bacterium]